MRALFTIIIFFAQICSASTFSQLDYKIYRQTKGMQNFLTIELTISGNLDEELLLNLPSSWGASQYFANLQNIRVLSPVNAVSKLQEQNLIIQMPTPVEKLQIAYDIINDNSDTSQVMNTIIASDLIQSPGYGLFALPNEVFNGQEINFSLQWENFPLDWHVITPYGLARSLQFKQTADKMLHSPYIAGKMRVYQIYYPEVPVYLSIHGEFDLTDKEMIASLDQIIKAQRSFFRDNNFAFYIIGTIQSNNPNSGGGTGLNNSFIASIPKDMSIDKYYLLYAHENLHNWIGGKLKNNQDEELNYWWSEGFTDYYARVLALRSGGISMEKFIEELNNFFQSYYLSPVLNAANIRIAQDFWKNYDVERLPYLRGFMFAIYLNYQIKAISQDKSLDNLMLDLLSFAYQEEFSSTLFKKVASSYVPYGIDNQMQQFIDSGQTIWLNELKDILPLEVLEIGQYELGFDWEELQQNQIIKNIDPNSNAYKAGLRDGDKIRYWDFPKGLGNSDQEVIVGKLFRSYKFRPENSAKRAVYRVRKVLSPADIDNIKNFFGAKLLP